MEKQFEFVAIEVMKLPKAGTTNHSELTYRDGGITGFEKLLSFGF